MDKLMAWFRWLKQRLQDLFARYGTVAIVTYFAIFGLTWIGFALAIRQGISVEGAAAETGSIGAAYVATKLTQPIRILATLAATPFVAMFVERVRPGGNSTTVEPPDDGPKQ